MLSGRKYIGETKWIYRSVNRIEGIWYSAIVALVASGIQALCFVTHVHGSCFHFGSFGTLCKYTIEYLNARTNYQIPCLACSSYFLNISVSASAYFLHCLSLLSVCY
jgi:hypothetical protein